MEIGERNILAEVKVVEPGYPFYGQVELASGRPFSDVLTPGNIIVGPALLERLGLEVGTPLRVGDTTLTIQDVSLGEPDRPVDFFSLGPRVFVAAADLDALNLVKRGSRVRFTELLRSSLPKNDH